MTSCTSTSVCSNGLELSYLYLDDRALEETLLYENGLDGSLSPKVITFAYIDMPLENWHCIHELG